MKSHYPLRDDPLAQAWVETLLPAHPVLGSADPRQLLERVSYWLDHSHWQSQGLRALLHTLNWQCRRQQGRPLDKLSADERHQWLQRQWNNALTYPLLRALSLPLKLAYLSQPDIAARAGQRSLPPIPADEPARWMQQVMRPDDVLDQGRLEVDAVVIGSGAGGALAAYELASQGLAVLILEEGAHFQRGDFASDPLSQIHRLYRNHGLTGSLGNTLIPIPLGRAVGGTTVINSGTCLRTPPAVLAEWRQMGLTDLTDTTMASYFDEVEALLQVQPADPAHIGPIARIIARGSEATGLTQSHALLRNAAGCDGQGLCQFGCPTGAKQSTNVSVIPRALDRGAVLLPEVRVEAINCKGDRVTGISARDRRTGQAFQVQARAVVVAAGSLLTPQLLRDTGVRNAWLGTNLSLHPAGAVTGWFPGTDFGNSRTIPQGFGIDDMADEGLMFEGATPPLPALAMIEPSVGRDFTRAVARYRETAFFGFMIRDRSRGRVWRGPKGTPLVGYRLNRPDFQLFCRGLDTLARIYLAAGAREVRFPGNPRLPVITSRSDLNALWQSRPRPRDFLISAYHPLGTARIGASPRQAVCGADHGVYGLQGLYVMDGAAVPSSLGANPQITIMALALKASRGLAQRLHQDA